MSNFVNEDGSLTPLGLQAEEAILARLDRRPARNLAAEAAANAAPVDEFIAAHEARRAILSAAEKRRDDAIARRDATFARAQGPLVDDGKGNAMHSLPGDPVTDEEREFHRKDVADAEIALGRAITSNEAFFASMSPEQAQRYAKRLQDDAELVAAARQRASLW